METLLHFSDYLGKHPTSVALAAGIFTLSLLLKAYIIKRSPPANPARQKIYDLIQGLARATRWYFLLVLAVYLGFLPIKLANRVRETLDQIFYLVVLLQVGLWGTWWFKHWAEFTFKQFKKTDSARASAIGILKILGQSVLWILLVLAGLANIGFDITTLIAGLGVGGIALALASQKILSDLFASLTLILDKPFVVGDFIITGETRGHVENIGLKTTRIRSLDGELLVLPNSDILESRIRNFKVMKRRRNLVTLGVVYQTPLEKLRKISDLMKEIIESYEEVKFDRAHFKEYGPYSINFEVVYFVKSPDYKVYIRYVENINLDIYDRFQKEGIQFAYPTQTIQMEGPTILDTSTGTNPPDLNQ